jgi:hypothetical protein
MLGEALAAETAEWRFRPADLVNKVYNKELQKKFDALYRNFEIR